MEVPLHLLPTATLDRKSCQIQVQATVPPKTQPSMPTGLAPELIWTFRRRRNLLSLLRFERRFVGCPACSLIRVSATVSWPQLCVMSARLPWILGNFSAMAVLWFNLIHRRIWPALMKLMRFSICYQLHGEIRLSWVSRSVDSETQIPKYRLIVKFVFGHSCFYFAK